MILIDGTDWQPTEDKVDKWKDAYKGTCVDVDRELVLMDLWCDSNPQKRKTSQGISGFCTRWLKKALDQGGKSIELQKAQEDDFRFRLKQRRSSIRNTDIADNLVDISWLSGDDYLMAKQYYLNKLGYYWDGETKHG